MSFTCSHHGWRHALNPCPVCHPEHQPAPVVMTELKAEDIVSPLSTLDQFTDEEMLYWASPYFDELQAKKIAHQEALNQEAKNG